MKTENKKKIADNHGLNILILADTLPNFLVTTSKTKWDY